MNMVNKLKKGLASDRVSMKSIIAFVLFGAIILVFVFFGMRQDNLGGVGYAARVNNTLVTVADLRSETTRLEQMYAPMFGGQAIGESQRQFLQQQALESLINQELVSQAAEKAGVLATDAEVQNVITTEYPVFMREGRFSRDNYFQLLQANNMNPSGFEDRIRKDKRSQRARRLMQIVSMPLNLEVEKLRALKAEQMNVAFAKFEKDDVLKTMSLPSSEISQKTAQPEFQKKMEDYYNGNKAEFAVNPEAKAQHILVKSDGTPAGDKKALETIQDIKKKTASQDFGQLAKQFSEDTGSKDNGGDLGFFGRGRMVPEFENAAFSLPIGQVSEPVKTNFGYHLLKVTERKEQKQKTFEEVKGQIAQKLAATDLYDSYLKALEDALAQKNEAQVDTALQKLGVKWEETGFFDLSADLVPKVNSMEASKAVVGLSNQTKVLDRLVRDGDQKFVLKLKAVKKEAPTETLALDQVLARERSSEIFSSWVEGVKTGSRIERNLQLVQ